MIWKEKNLTALYIFGYLLEMCTEISRFSKILLKFFLIYGDFILFFLIVDFVTKNFLNFTTVQNFAQKEMGAES
jgi:hypothetical protein